MSPRYAISDSKVDPTSLQTIETAVKVIFGEPCPPLYGADEGGDSGVLGPWGPLACTPSIVTDFLKVGKDAYTPSFVKPRNRQLALLGLCSVMKVPYVHAVHKHVTRSLGVTEQQWSEGLQQKVPQGLENEGEAMAYRLGLFLTQSNGVMDDELWTRAMEVLGKNEFHGIVHIVGIYKYVVTLAQVNSG